MHMHTHCLFACAMPSGQCWKVCSLGAIHPCLTSSFSLAHPLPGSNSCHQNTQTEVPLGPDKVCVYTVTPKRDSDTQVTIKMSKCNFITHKWYL